MIERYEITLIAPGGSLQQSAVLRMLNVQLKLQGFNKNKSGWEFRDFVMNLEKFIRRQGGGKRKFKLSQLKSSV